MGSQRIVFTSPWKLGLFVFLLVVGCGFGLIYAYLQFFGGSLEFKDERALLAFYAAAGGVALLGLLGYVAVVSAAQPMDRIVSGGRRRSNLLKELSKVEDPREVDTEHFESDPDLGAVVERWRAHRLAGCEAEEALQRHREMLSAFVTQLREAAQGGGAIAAEGAEGAVAALVATTNSLLEELAQLRAQPPAAAPSVGQASDSLRAAWRDGSDRLRRHQRDVARFAAAIAGNGEQLAAAAVQPSRATRGESRSVSPVVPTVEDLLLDSNLGSTCQRNRERVGTLRQQLETLAEEANALAITAALQVSRMGDHASSLLPLTEQIRNLSTRFQKASADLKLCEYDQEATATQVAGLAQRVVRDWNRVAGAAGGGQGAAGVDVTQFAGSIGRAAAGLSQLAQALAGDIDRLEGALGDGSVAPLAGDSPAATADLSRPASAPFIPVPPPPMAELAPEEQLARIHQELFASGSAPSGAVPHATPHAAPHVAAQPAPRAPQQPPAAPTREASAPVRPAPQRVAMPPLESEEEAVGAQPVYDLTEFGAVQLDDEDESEHDRVYELAELGAVQI